MERVWSGQMIPRCGRCEFVPEGAIETATTYLEELRADPLLARLTGVDIAR